jgi:dehydrogenase/reductase SDR family member 12
MGAASVIDTILDRSVVLGYGDVGLKVRRRLPGWPADPPRLDGKVALVTGATSGIGLAAAAALARLGASVRALARSHDRAALAAARCRERAGIADADVRPAVCDVSSLGAMRDFARRFSDEEQALDVLVNNAGVMPAQRTYTPDGLELMFATHVLAPHVLTGRLLPLLQAAAPSRVINVTSGGQYGQRIPAGDLQSEYAKYAPRKLYARTKREELVLTVMWAERLRGTGVHVHAMHPGWADTPGIERSMPLFRSLSRPVMRTPDEGADTIAWLAGAPEAVSTSGLFWQDRHPRPPTYRLGPGPDDQATRQQLWDYVARLGDG